MTIYQFMMHYMDSMLLAEENGFIIPEEFHKPLKFYDEIKKRAECPVKVSKEDSLCKACRKIFMAFSEAERKDLYRSFLLRWGIQEEPFKVLYTSKTDIPERKYVLAFIFDIDQDRCRNGGNGETFYGSGESKTKDEFWDEIQAVYKDYPFAEVLDISNVYTERPSILYRYHGYLYREFVNKEEE